jgi:TRAP-type C4-dicarboxylate transport system substrate-binding protein
MKGWKTCFVFGLAIVFCFGIGNALGADKVTIRALGSFQKQIQYSVIEKPFYDKLKQEAGDRFNIQFRSMDELGQKGFDALRQLRSGVFDVIQTQLGYISGDDPYWQGLDIMGVAPDIETAREVVEAFRETLDQRLQDKFNGKVLAIWPYGTQVFYFKEKISGLDDFKGKKIRVFSRPMADFVQYFGATGITLPFPEVYMSLQRGVIDGAITGALAGNTASWFEVSNCLFPLPMGFGLQMHTANLDFWKKLSPENRAYLTKKFKELEDDFWRYGDLATQDGINCNTGKGKCEYGQKGKMNLVVPSDADNAKAKKAAEEVILKQWAEGCNRVDPKCSENWNAEVGKVVNIQIQLD